MIAWNLHPEMLPKLGAVAAELGLPFEPVPLERNAGGRGDHHHHLVAAASLMAAHVSPGVHLACMGTDTVGKQEVEPALGGGARAFTDEVAQSVTIGEAQHAVAAGDTGRCGIVPLGDVLVGGIRGGGRPTR